MDEIRIDHLEVYGFHGVYPEENRKGQLFYVNLVLYTETRAAGITDNLSLSTNYGEVCHLVNDYMQTHTFKLIESVAESVAREILLHFPLVKAVSVEIQKPQAPIGLPFGNVSVKIKRAWHKAYIALGSNMGDTKGYIQMALEELENCENIRTGKVSTLIETKPYGGVEQDDFLNGAVEIDTLYTPYELLDFLHVVEQKARRKREIHWGPRTLDLDILFYDRLVMKEQDLIIPHTDLQNRDFVLKPMAEIAPCFKHPVFGKTMCEMWEELQNRQA